MKIPAPMNPPDNINHTHAPRLNRAINAVLATYGRIEDDEITVSHRRPRADTPAFGSRHGGNGSISRKKRRGCSLRIFLANG